MASLHPTLRIEQSIAAALDRLASGGIRGMTLRDVAADAGMPLGGLVSHFPSKDRLLAATFAEALRHEAARLDAVTAAARRLDPGGSGVADLLWTLCQPGSEGERALQLVLGELLLQAPNLPYLRPLLGQRLEARRAMVRLLAARPGAEDAADIVALILMAEELFAPACAHAPEWRIVAAHGFRDTGAALGLWPAGDAATHRAAARFHADPEPGPDMAPGSDVRARIVSAAAAIVEELGVGAVTNRAVAERAGCSLAATTYHFATVSDLLVAGVLEVFARTRRAAGGTGRLDGGAESVVRWIAGRHAPEAAERVGTRGMAEIALAAARGQISADLGLLIRRQRGTITHARLEARGLAPSRGRTAAAAQWFAGVYLACAGFPDAESLFDFDAQALLVGERLFGLPIGGHVSG